MSGHSKWSKIKRKKGASDAKRSKIFGRVIKEITVAVKEGGSGDPDFNPRLRMAVANAKGVNMPKDTIERAIKKATESGGAQYLELTYEGYAPGGVAVFVECTSDNQNRTVANIRSYFSKSGGSLATSGSVDFLFERKSIFIVEMGSEDEDDFTLALIDAGADDVEFDEGEATITAPFEQFGEMQRFLEEGGYSVKQASLMRLPKAPTAVDESTAKSAWKLIDTIEDDDDVQAVFHNMELNDELLAILENE